MASTASPLALPYPTLADPPDGPGAFSSLANRIQATLGQDTGWVPLTIQSGMTGICNYRRIGAAVTFYWYVTKTTATTGTDIWCCTLPGGGYPSAGVNFVSGFNDTGTCRGNVNAGDGSIKFINITNTQSITFFGTATWPVTF